MEQRPPAEVADVVFGAEPQHTGQDREGRRRRRTFEKTVPDASVGRIRGTEEGEEPGIEDCPQEIFDVNGRVVKSDDRTSIEGRLSLWLWDGEHISKHGGSCCKNAGRDSEDSISSLEYKTPVGKPEIVHPRGRDFGARFLRCAGCVHGRW